MHRVLAVSCLFLLAACSKSPGERLAEAAIRAGTGEKVEVSEDGGKVTLKTEQGEVQVASGDAAALPADFPRDVFLPAGHHVESVVQMGGATIVEVQAPGSIASVYGQADARMQAQGWKQLMTSAQDDARVAMYEKDTRSAMLSLSREDGQDGVRMHVQLASRQ